MTLPTILAIIAAAAAIACLAVAGRERNRRRAAVRLAADLERQAATEAEARRRLIGVAAHELRSPVSVVLGYQELIADGIYGDLDDRGREALNRIRLALEQQLRILEGTVDLAGAGRPRSDGAAPFELEPLFRSVLADARAFGVAYNVVIETERRGPLPTIIADAARFRRALDMALAAAVKGSPGRRIMLQAAPTSDGADFTVLGSGLDPGRDDPGGLDGMPLGVSTGAALRIAFARRAIGADAGSVILRGEPDAAILEIRLRGTVTVPRQIDGESSVG